MKRLWSGLVTRINQLRRRPAAALPGRPGDETPKPSASAATAQPGGATAPRPRPPRQSSGPPRGRHLVYAPERDGRADPGEIVWTWVPYEEDASQGKDRPVLVVGREGTTLLGLMLSSQHDRDGQRNWLALGTGEWDRDERQSWVRLDRVLRVAEDGIRREGAILDRTRFGAVARALRTGYGWR